MYLFLLGHNADDIAETVIMNGKFYLSYLTERDPEIGKLIDNRAHRLFILQAISENAILFPVLRGDIARLRRCTAIMTVS